MHVVLATGSADSLADLPVVHVVLQAVVSNFCA